MEKQTPGFHDGLFKAGLWMIAISALIFCVPLLLPGKPDQFFGLFVINYGLSLAYFFMLAAKRKLKKDNGGAHCLFLLLILFLISAYALNRFLPVFELSVNWLSVLLVAVCGSYIALAWSDALPAAIRSILAGFVGIGFALFIYLSVYLFPIYPISILGMIMLGISIHAYIPLLFVIFTIRWVLRRYNDDRAQLYGFAGGVVCALLLVAAFTWQWSRLNREANEQYSQSYLAQNDDLPSWTKVAQTLPHNWLTEKFLKAGLVYTTPSNTDNFFDFRMPSRSFEEVRKHDPLVVLATLINPRPAMNVDDRIRVLQSGYKSRHKTEDRLWNGDDLATTSVVSNVRIWPQYRLAYTEKILTVANVVPEQRWRGDEEAIYTFHLPEGGVVTSLSLWINGQEVKAILTTKGKADSAYKQIVGVERHDPSVVHWQEGNTVSVRVFPVPANGNRVFKIGVTAPLTLKGKELHYDNIYFDGPDATAATEVIQMNWLGNNAAPALNGFEEKGHNTFVRKRNYDEYWSLKFPAGAMVPAAFNFRNQGYTIQSYEPERQAAVVTNVYLDVNETWTEQEFEQVMKAIGNRNAFVYDDGLIALSKNNAQAIFKRLHRHHFGLFPLYEISQPASALLISKSASLSPNMADLKESPFAKKLETWIMQSPKLKLYNLDNQLSPYLKTLKEHRVFYYEQGDAAMLQQLLASNRFAGNVEDEHHIVIDNARVMITKGDAVPGASGPDHLMRLFAYNHLMQQLKRGIYTNLETDSSLVSEAQQAYVVTPLSSLVVLETAADYERFNIKDQNNSLKNASMKSKGAVPEPHEWALIILAIGLLLWMKFRDSLKHIIAGL